MFTLREVQNTYLMTRLSGVKREFYKETVVNDDHFILCSNTKTTKLSFSIAYISG